MSEMFVASGGWCAPGRIDFNEVALTPVDFPKIEVSRGGIRFDRRPSPEQMFEASVLQRAARRMAEVRHLTIERACAEALANGWDIHIYEPPVEVKINRNAGSVTATLGQLGIAFTESEFGVPTITYRREHLDFFDWEDD